MARLPNPGSDNGTWGSILNDFLGQTHNADGTLKANVVAAGQVQDGAVDSTKLSGGVQATLSAALSEVTHDKNWVIAGTINVAAGDVDYITPAYLSVPAGFVAVLVSVRARINSGTNVNLRITRNDVNMGGLASIDVTTAGLTITGLNLALADGDLIAPVVNSTAGGPQNMTVMISYKITKA